MITTLKFPNFLLLQCSGAVNILPVVGHHAWDDPILFWIPQVEFDELSSRVDGSMGVKDSHVVDVGDITFLEGKWDGLLGGERLNVGIGVLAGKVVVYLP